MSNDCLRKMKKDNSLILPFLIPPPFHFLKIKVSLIMSFQMYTIVVQHAHDQLTLCPFISPPLPLGDLLLLLSVYESPAVLFHFAVFMLHK